MQSEAGLPRLRELRIERNWTQQEVADRLARLAWLHRHKEVGVTADMVAKWERGAKRPSALYRELLCLLLGTTADQVGLGPAPAAQTGAPASDNMLLSMLDNAAGILDQLGKAGAVLEPQMFAVWKEQISNRRAMLAMLDTATDPNRAAGASRSEPASIADLDQLADRYQALYDTVAPAALLTSVAAHLRMTDEALRASRTPGERRRLSANRARVAILAGRLAFDDLGNSMAARAHYGLALDAAHEADDANLAAVAHGYTAQLAAAEGSSGAALHHLAAARRARVHPLVGSWLSAIEATVQADAGDIVAALNAIDDASAALDRATTAPALPWFDDHDAVSLAAATGHVLLRAQHYDDARDALTDALNQFPSDARRARMLCLIDRAAVELGCGSLDEACSLAAHAAESLHRAPYATGTNRLLTLRATADHLGCSSAFRALDDHLGQLSAA